MSTQVLEREKVNTMKRQESPDSVPTDQYLMAPQAWGRLIYRSSVLLMLGSSLGMLALGLLVLTGVVQVVTVDLAQRGVIWPAITGGTIIVASAVIAMGVSGVVFLQGLRGKYE